MLCEVESESRKERNQKINNTAGEMDFNYWMTRACEVNIASDDMRK